MRLESTYLDSFDPVSMEEALSGTTIRHVQLARGRFLGKLLSIQAGQYRLNYGKYNLPLHAQGAMLDDLITVGFILDGVGDYNVNGRITENPAPVVLRESAELDFFMAPRTEWMALQVKRSALEALDVSPENHSDSLVNIPGSVAMEARESMRRAVAELRAISAGGNAILSPGTYSESILSGIFDELIAALQANDAQFAHARQPPLAARQLVKRAVDYMHERLGGIMQIGLMCADLKTSYKTLERAFLKYHGITPKQYLQYARLARARRLLLLAENTGQSIAEVATSCGIFHLSRFAQLYRATYGELPSMTLGTGPSQ